MKKTLSLILALVMILSMSVNVFAVEDQLPPDIGPVENVEELKNLGLVTVTLAANDTNGQSYRYIAAEDGTFSCYIDQITAGVQGDIVVTNETTGEVKRLSKDGVGGYGKEVSVEVSKGDAIKIQVTASGAAKLTWASRFSPALGSSKNPIYPAWTWNEDLSEATATVTAPAGTTYYAVKAAGMVLTVNGKEYGTLVATGEGPAVFPIENEGEKPAKYELRIAWPVGSYSKPDVLEEGTNVADIPEGSKGYYYNWTAEEDGELTIEVSGDTGLTYVINNLTTGVEGQLQYSDGKPVSTSVAVAAGDEIQILVQTRNPGADGIAPAGKVTVKSSFAAKGSETPGDILMGDVNGDKKVNSMDAMLVLRHYVGFVGADQLTVAAADVNGDGNINSVDAMLILRHYVGFITKFPAEK